MKRSALSAFIRGKKFLLLGFIATAIAAHGSVTITGHVKVGDTTAPATNVSKIRMQLMYCVQQGQNTPRVIGTGALISPQFDITPSSDGSYSFTSYGNDVITCDTAGNSRWRVIMIYKNGQQSYNEYQVPDGGTFNLDTASTSSSGATAYTPTAVLTNPAGDQTVAQPGSTNLNINRLNVTTCTGCGGTPPVTSVFGRIGAVVQATNDYNFNQLAGTVANAQLANSYSGVGSCPANQWVNVLNGNAAPGCAQIAFSNLSGSATLGQLPTQTGTGNIMLATSPTATDLTVNQAANGDNLLFGKRFTDTSPTGNLIYFQNAANNADLFKLDVAGVATHWNNLIFGSDNSFDIGASAATRPRSVFVGTSVVFPASTTAAAIAVSGSTTFGLTMDAGASGPRIWAVAGGARRAFAVDASTGNTGGVILAGTFALGWVANATDTGLAAADLYLRRLGTDNLQQGRVASASPAAQTYTLGESSRSGTDSNVKGSDGTIRPGNGTGTAGGGVLHLQTAPTASTGSAANTYGDVLTISENQHVKFASNAAPSITAGCGTSPSVTGSDNVMQFNVGTGGTATSCTVTFAKAYVTAPLCFANDEGRTTPLTRAVGSTTTVVIDTSSAWTASSKIDVACYGN